VNVYELMQEARGAPDAGAVFKEAKRLLLAEQYELHKGMAGAREAGRSFLAFDQRLGERAAAEVLAWAPQLAEHIGGLAAPLSEQEFDTLARLALALGRPTPALSALLAGLLYSAQVRGLALAALEGAPRPLKPPPALAALAQLAPLRFLGCASAASAGGGLRGQSPL
jgi:hypothetical protein